MFRLYTKFTWTNPIEAVLCHFYFTLTGGTSIHRFRYFEPLIYSQAISASYRAISKCPVAPLALYWKVNRIGDFHDEVFSEDARIYIFV